MDMDIYDTCLFNKKFKSYKHNSHHEKPHVKRSLDELAGRYSKDFSYYTIIDRYDTKNIYIKSKIYSSYKIINKYSYYLDNGKYKFFEYNMYKKNKIYNIIAKYTIEKYKRNNDELFLLYRKSKYKVEFNIENNINDKYFSHKKNLYDLNKLIIQTSYIIKIKYLQPNWYYINLQYYYNYIGNYIYERRDKSQFNDKYKFISNWRICILFI